jgi:hypothetical protein
MRPASDPNSGISSNNPSKRQLFGDVGQKHTLKSGSISKIVEPDVYYENTPQSVNWTMGNGLQSHNLSWDGDPGLSETLQSLAISIKDTAVKQGWKMVYNQDKVDRLLGALKSLSCVFEELHAKGWAAGYSHPDNIFIKKDGTVFLADLGFYYTGDAESSFAPSWVKDTRPEAFYWENDTPQIRMAKPGSTVDFKESDTRLFGRILAAVISTEFHAKPDVSKTPIGPLADYWKIALDAFSGKVFLDGIKRAFGGKPRIGTPPVDSASNGFPTKLVLGLFVLLSLGLGSYFVSKNWKITPDKTVAPIVTIPALPIIPPLPTPVTTDIELEKLYQAAITCTKDERLGNFSKLAAYNKESPEKFAKVIAVRLMLSSEFQAELFELDTKVQTDALLEYPTATAMEKLLVKVTEIRKAGGIYEDEKTKVHENSNFEFATRRIQELRRE